MEKDRNSQDRLGRSVEDWVLIGLLAGSALLYSAQRHNDRSKPNVESPKPVPAHTVPSPQ